MGVPGDMSAVASEVVGKGAATARTATHHRAGGRFGDGSAGARLGDIGRHDGFADRGVAAFGAGDLPGGGLDVVIGGVGKPFVEYMAVAALHAVDNHVPLRNNRDRVLAIRR